MEDVFLFLELVPEDILIYYDGMRLFTARSAGDNLFLLHHLKTLERSDIFLVSLISEEMVKCIEQDLTGDEIDIWYAFDTPFCWIMDQGVDDIIISLKLTTIEEVKRDYSNCLGKHLPI